MDATPAFKKAQNLLNEARHNYSFVLLGKGVHNIEYAFKLLNAANNKTEQALAAIDKNYKPQEFQTRDDLHDPLPYWDREADRSF